MTKIMMSVAFVLVCSTAMAQYEEIYRPGFLGQQAGYPLQLPPPPYVQPPLVPVFNPNQTVVNQPMNQTVVNQPGALSQLPIGEWRDGVRESFIRSDVHEIRPIRDYQYPHYPYQTYQQPVQYQYQTYQPAQCYQPPVQCYQPVQRCYPQQQYYYQQQCRPWYLNW